MRDDHKLFPWKDHTPFPWHKRIVREGYTICGPPEEGNPHPRVCTVHNNMYGNVKINANLILGVPQMFQACEAMERYRAHRRHCGIRKSGWICFTCEALWGEASELLTEALKAVHGE